MGVCLPLLASGGGVAPLPPLQDDLVIRTTTSLVEVRVAAEDKHGNPVTDLQQSEFTILDNGKPQAIRLFHAFRPSGASATGAAQLSGGAEATPPGYAVILLDWLNTSYSNRLQVKDEALKLLREYQSRQRLAVFVLSRDNPRLLCDFTYDRDLLAVLLERLSPEPEDHAGPTSSPRPLPAGRAVTAAQQAKHEEELDHAHRQVVESARALDNIANHLNHVAGRKSLLWVSMGFPMVVDGLYYYPYLEPALGRLNQSDTAIYAIDASGLTMVPNPNLDTLMEFARRTGGRVFYNTNDLEGSMRQSLEDPVESYTLGFHAPDSVQPGLHGLEVKVSRPGVHLRYRESYDPGSVRR